MLTLHERPAASQDAPWLWELYSELLRPSIEQLWGWNQEIQHINFHDHLPYSLFSIIENKNSRIAAYATKTDEARIYLHMLLVENEQQLQGVGTHVLNEIKKRAIKAKLPIDLSVIPTNDVAGFYQKNGFKLLESKKDKLLFRWLPV